MKEKTVGLYLGVNSIGAVVAEANNIVSSVRFEFSSLESKENDSKNEEIRWEALINKTLREVGANVKDIFVSLSDKEFIFRSLDLPLMNRKEIEASLVYEVEKHVPFKMQELEWDYGYVRFPKERKTAISFIGIRENNFKRINAILSRLGLNVIIIEPSCISLVRTLKTHKDFSQLKNFAILDFTLTEAYLTFFQNDLPVFNRYLIVPRKDDEFDSATFIESVNFSLQYFKREFKTYNLEKFIVIGEFTTENLIEPLKSEIQAEIQVLNPSNLVGREGTTVENAKAFGVVAKNSTYKFRPNLKKTEKRSIASIASVSQGPLRLGLIFSILGIGLIVSIALSVLLGNDTMLKGAELKSIEKKIDVPSELKEFSWEKIKAMLEAKKERIAFVKNIKSSLVRFSQFFNTMGKAGLLPRKLWLDKLEFDSFSNKPEVMLEGYIFRDSGYEESIGVDEFISNLTSNEVISSIFSNVELKTSNKVMIDKFEVTSFSIDMR